MVDAITLVITVAFGGIVALVIAAFYLIQHRNRNIGAPSSPFESRDYYSQYDPSQYGSRRSQEPKYSYDSRRPFRSDAEIEERTRRMRQNAMTIMLVIIVVALIAVVIAALYDPINLIFFIFLLPIAISFLRSRRNRNSQEGPDSDSKR